MKKYALILLILTIISGCEMPQKSETKTISIEKFEQLAQNPKFTIIDLRTPEEIATGKIKANAIEINFYAAGFEAKLSQLPKDKKYLIYCNSGNRSGKTLKKMQELGFQEVYDLAGGISAWNRLKLKN